MFLFILFILSCLSDNSLVHEVETIEYETITEIEYVYVEDTAPPPQDTSLDLLPIWVDSFTQPNSMNGIDILWVIDRSGSMTNEAAQIVTGIETMIAALPESDWRLVMLNISPNPQAIMNQMFPLIPGDGLTEAWAMYNALGGSNREEGFSAVYTYMTENPYSQTWMRPDASLLIVFVSDEDEQSFTNYPTTTSFLNWLNTRRTDTHITSIVHFPQYVSQCNFNPTAVGDRYIEAVDLTGGTKIDICTDDWSVGITEALNQVEPYDNYRLSKRVKYPQYLQVFYDGRPVHPDEWRFDSASNTVWFNPLPAGNVLVEIAYYYEPTH